VVGAEVDPEIAREWHKGIRAGGTHMPGAITAGTFYQDGERVFWDVHEPEKTLVIQLRDERYARLVIEVEDPHSTAAAIKAGAAGETGRAKDTFTEPTAADGSPTRRCNREG
jgi:hypothetical protein